MVVSGSPGAEPQTTEHRLLDEPVAVYPYAKPGSMTSTPDGDHLYAAEGGAITIIEAASPTGPPIPDNYRYPVKRVPVGRRGVLPVAMKLDPGAAAVPAFGANDILYLAGGRDGLWAIEADVLQGGVVNRATRLDDSGNESNLATQFNRKWCNDIDFITLDDGETSKTYLLALFGKKDSSRLRVYELTRARGAARNGFSAPAETGFELLPDKGIKLGRHSNSAADDYSYAFGMDVDEQHGDVYVAMGFHGIARVHLSLFFGQVNHSVSWGPFFGEGSPYAVNVDATLYDDIHYREEAGGPVLYQHAPIFLDVAVDRRTAPHHWLYAAVDHLGVVGFDLEAPWNDFIYGTSGVEFHQEGVMATSTLGKQWIELVDDNGGAIKVRSFARRIEVVNVLTGSIPNAALVVTTGTRTFLKVPGMMNPGRSMDYQAGNLGGIPAATVSQDFAGKYYYTLCYDLNDRVNWTTRTINVAGIVTVGGELHVPELQEPDSLCFFAGESGFQAFWPGRGPASDPLDADQGRHTLLRAEFLPPSQGQGWPPPGIPTLPAVPDRGTYRERDYRTGRWVYRATFNAANPEILALGSNEGGLRADGPLTLDLSDSSGAEIVADNFLPYVGGVYDERNKDGTNGIVFEPLGVVAQNGWEYRFGHQRCVVGTWPDGSDKWRMRWRLAKFWGGSTGAAPYQEKEIFFTMPPDKFLDVGYYLYTGGTLSAEYNADVGVGGEMYLFANTLSSPQGVWVLRMDLLMDFMDAPSGTYFTEDGKLYSLGDSPWSDAVVGELTTHPEFWNIPECRFGTPPDAAKFFLSKQEIRNSVQTYHPHMFRLPSAGSGPPDTWVLAVPSVVPWCDDGLPIFMDPVPLGQPNWRPDPVFRVGAGFSKMMVRFFDVSDPSLMHEATSTLVGSHALPAYTLVGPETETAATHVRTAHVVDLASNDRYFCFVADLGGHLEVFEITGLLPTLPDHDPSEDPSFRQFGATISPAPFASYEPLDALCDQNSSNIFGLEVDPASWIDGDQVQRDEVYVYLSVLRVGIEVLRFDVDAPAGERLEWLELIQTPGEPGFLNISEKPVGLTDSHGHIRQKILFEGDSLAGFRIYTYGF